MSDIPPIPIIPSIHQRVYEAASQPGALNMDHWHTCETTHCRAGWVVHLAGSAGKMLERWFNRKGKTGSGDAALAIYRASSSIEITEGHFFQSKAAALADMRRCAKLEAAAEAAQRGDTSPA